MKNRNLQFASLSVLAAVVIGSCGQQQSLKFAGGVQGAVKSPDATPRPQAGDSVGQSPAGVTTGRENPGAGAPDSLQAKDGKGEILVEEEAKIFGLDITRQFVSGSVADGRMELNLATGMISEEVTLKNTEILVKNELKFEQLEKPSVAETLKQGAPGIATADQFDQSQSGVIDILMVIDNSGSMAEEQLDLSTKLSALIGKISMASWQIGVVTTDPANPCLRGLIKSGDVDISAAFAKGINAGVYGSGLERGALTAAVGLGKEVDLNRDGVNETKCTTKWLRDNSSVAVVLVSDEDNCGETDAAGFNYCGKYDSNSQKWAPDPWAKVSYLTDYLSTIRTLKTNARIYGIFALPNVACTTAAVTATQYQTLVADTGGMSGSICDADYSSTLDAISNDVTYILKSQFSLKSTPDAGTVKVSVNDIVITDTAAYKVSGTTLSFLNPPAKDSKITVSYVYGSIPVRKEFFIQETPAVGSVAVLINGKDTKDFTVDYATRGIKFTSAPEDNAEIRINYRQEVALSKVVDIGRRAVSGSVKALVNGVDTGIESYNAISGIVTFLTAPIEKAKIVISFDTKELVVPTTKFPLVTAWKAVRDLVASDKLTGESIGATWADNVLSIDPAAFADGRAIAITYRDESTWLGKKFELSNMPIGGKVEVLGIAKNDSVITCSQNLLTVVGATVAPSCDLSQAAKVILTYQYAVGMKNEFRLLEVKNPEAYTWSVLVDGVATSEFTRAGSVINFANPLPVGTVVKVIAKVRRD